MEKKKYIIGVCGGSGSGKTRFTRHLRKRCENKDVTFISLDNYYFPREQQKVDAQGKRNFDLPESIDIDQLKADLDQLILDKPVVQKEYTFNNDKKEAQEFVLQPASVYIVEGLFIYHYEALKEVFDLKLFISVNDALKVTRRICRDQKERNYPIDDVVYRYEHHVLPSFTKFIAPYKSEADIIINNNNSFEKALNVISAYIDTKTKK